MRWEDERYVRVYTRDTLDWQALSFEAQGLFALVLRKVDRAGILRLGKHGKRGVAVAVGHGHRWQAVEPALEELLTDGCVAIRGEFLVVPNFVAAQEAQASDKARQATKRERDRDKAMAAGNGHLSDVAKDELARMERAGETPEPVTHPVTPERHAGPVTQDGHAGGVTPSRAVPAVPSEPAKTFAGAVAPRAADVVQEPKAKAAGAGRPGDHPPKASDRQSEPVNEPVAVGTGGAGDHPQFEDIPDGADGTWQLPWAGPASRRIPGRGEKKTRPDKLVMFVEWMLYRQGERGDEETDLAWGQVLALLKRAVAAHGEELVRKAWLAWLMDPWAAGLSPPYQLVKFLAVEQVKKQVARAKAFDGWEVDKLAPEDWQLPWLIDERRDEA